MGLTAVVVLLLRPASASTATAFVVNKTPATLVLDYYSTIFGSFIQYPPSQVAPYGTANWTLTGSVYQNFGFIEYDVYFKSPDFNGCVDLSYFWTSSSACAGRAGAPALSSPEVRAECYYYVTD